MYCYIRRKGIILILIFSLLFVSCSTTYVLPSFKEANDKIGKGSVDIYLNSGQVYKAKDITTEKDSTKLYDKSTDKIIYIRTKNIKVISETNHFYGFFEGILIGGGIGYLAGSVYDLKTQKSNDFPLAWVLAPFGAFVGFLFGTGIGHQYNYILPNGTETIDSSKVSSDNTIQSDN